jgi:glycosyltransferase involved in cell wall biosynthesis
LTNCSVVASRRWGIDVSPRKLESANRLSYRFAHKVLANSGVVADMLAHVDHVPPRKIINIPNFLEEKAFERDSETERERQRRAWGVSADCLLVGIVARLSPVKNHAVLFRAIASLHKGIELVVVGDGPSRADLEGLAVKLGIAARVHFVGEVVQRKNLHQYFDVSVLCSLNEGFPNSIIEAMAAARPVVVTPVGGVVDAVSKNVNGVYVSKDDPSETASALLMLDSNTGLRKTLGHAGRVIARRKFHQDTVIPALSEFYESLVESGTRNRKKQ